MWVILSQRVIPSLQHWCWWWWWCMCGWAASGVEWMITSLWNVPDGSSRTSAATWWGPDCIEAELIDGWLYWAKYDGKDNRDDGGGGGSRVGVGWEFNKWFGGVGGPRGWHEFDDAWHDASLIIEGFGFEDGMFEIFELPPAAAAIWESNGIGGPESDEPQTSIGFGGGIFVGWFNDAAEFGIWNCNAAACTSRRARCACCNCNAASCCCLK